MIRLCTCLICLLLAACFPGANGYYRPSASTGRLVNVCGGVTPAETIEFEHAGVRVRVSSDGYELRLLIQVPRQRSSQFLPGWPVA